MMIHQLAVSGSVLTLSASAIAEALPYSGDQKGYAYPLDPVTPYFCVPSDINDRGQIVGSTSTDSGNYHVVGFVTGPNGTGVKPLSLGGPDSTANAINSNGQLVGFADINATKSIAYITDKDGNHMRAVGPGEGAIAAGINDAGQVSGSFFNGAYAGFLTGPDGVGFTVLGTLGGPNTRAGRVNARGQVIGVSTIDDGNDLETHGFITGPNGVGMTDLMLPGATYSDPTDVNDLGQVTGTQWIGEVGSRQQFITGPDGADVKLLGTLGNEPGGRSEGGSINAKGKVVGDSTRGLKYGRILVTFTDTDGRMRGISKYIANLPEGVDLRLAARINNHNQIAAQGSDGKCYIVCPTKDCKRASD